MQRPKKPQAGAPPDDEFDAAQPSFFPPGIESWPDAEAWPLVSAPWPYTSEETTAIVAAMPNGSEWLSLHIIWYIRRYLAAHQTPGPRKKPNIHRELARAKKHTEALISALKSLTPESYLFLLENRGHQGNKTGFYELKAALYRFQRNRGLQVIPPAQDVQDGTSRRKGQGRPANDWDRLLYAHLERIWKLCHGETAPKRGWPRFRDACLKPLERMNVLRNLGDRSKEHISTKAKRGRN